MRPDTALTQIVSTPFGSFYTVSGAFGFGNFGTLAFTSATTATTSRLHGVGGSVGGATLAAAHGGVYDPYTNTIIIMGDNHITQLDLLGNIISDRDFLGLDGISDADLNFDQGTVDGAGHLLVASNFGHVLFVDYATTGLVGSLSNFATIPFLETNLDDIAPLVGAGSTDPDPVIPEPSTFVIWSLLAALGFGCGWRRRRKRA